MMPNLNLNSYPIICLAGPTASGKTDLALSLVHKLPLEIISVDSAMVYRGLNIGTAKPSPSILRQTPHHLIDICDPTEVFSAAGFCEQVLTLVPSILARGNIPLLVGGTMLYFHALLRGLSPLPPANAKVREAILQEAKSLGWDALHAKLADIDPKAAAKIHPHDPQRLQRALEVYELTGQPISSWQDQKPAQPWHTLLFALLPQDRARLHHAISLRFDHMLSHGFIEELEGLRRQYHLHKDLPSMRSVGYRQAWQYLEGELDYETFVKDAKTATRQLAKRQLTWLRQQFTEAISLNPEKPHLLDELFAAIQTWRDKLG